MLRKPALSPSEMQARADYAAAAENLAAVLRRPPVQTPNRRHGVMSADRMAERFLEFARARYEESRMAAAPGPQATP